MLLQATRSPLRWSIFERRRTGTLASRRRRQACTETGCRATLTRTGRDDRHERQTGDTLRLATPMCAECGVPIKEARHSIQCPKCTRTFHANCLPDLSGVCLRCKSTPQPVSRCVARQCIVCGLSNPDSASACTECRSPTAWLSLEECQEYHASVAR